MGKPTTSYLAPGDWRFGLLWPLLVVNLVGSVYGYYWYRQQLEDTVFYLWPLVPDSPLSTTLFALALLLALAGRRSGLVAMVACATNIKYGLWAMGVITHYWALGGPFTLTEGMLWLSHLGMAIQGFIFLRGMPFTWVPVLGTLVWMVFNDYMDYFHGLHPYLYAPGQEGFALWLAVLLTLLLIYILVRAGARGYRV